MEEFFPTLLLDLLVISITFSIVLMALIQKFKVLSFINKSWQVWFLNLIFSFLIGIPFAMTFYNITLKDSLWVGFFSFVGASGIYQALKNQKIINYTPSSISNKVTLDKKNALETRGKPICSSS